MSRKYLLVDAHNVIFAHPELSALHRRAASAAREHLIRLLERYQDAAGYRVVVVFDGSSSPRGTNELSSDAGVQVFYPRAGQSADAIIEQLVTKYAAERELLVATNDNLIRTAASAAGATIMDAESLFAEIRAAESDLSDTLARLRRRK